MELIRGLHNLRPRHRGCVATIGNYDGVHLGHQEVLRQLGERAAELGLPSTVVIFEPTPQEFFAPDRAPPRITRLREKLQLLDRFGAARVLCLRFDRTLADMEPEAFIDSVLLDGLAVRHLVVGDDFRFGHGRRGDFEMLRRAGEAHGFEVARMPTCSVDGERVSSTRVRNALSEGDLDEAARLLGRPYTICGRVVEGERLGRTIGYPTANIRLHHRATPLRGVLLVAVRGLDGGPRYGVASLGTRPTVNGEGVLLEVFVLDWQGDLYGRHLQVEFVHFLRPEWRFDSVDAMRAQIDRDVAQSRALLAAGT